mgnify:CR=1 FL=1
MQSVPMKMVYAYFRALQCTKVLLCPFHCRVEKQIGSCTLEFISVPLAASYCRIKKHHKVSIPVPAGNLSIGSGPTFLTPPATPRFHHPFGKPSFLSLYLFYNCNRDASTCTNAYKNVDEENVGETGRLNDRR